MTVEQVVKIATGPVGGVHCSPLRLRQSEDVSDPRSRDGLGGLTGTSEEIR